MLRLNAWARCDWRCPPGWHHHEDEGVDRVLWEPETQGQGPQCHQPGVLGNRVSAIVHVMYMLLHACDMLLHACDMNVNTEWNDLVLHVHVSGNIYAWMLTVIHELVFILCKMIKFFCMWKLLIWHYTWHTFDVNQSIKLMRITVCSVAIQLHCTCTLIWQL